MVLGISLTTIDARAVFVVFLFALLFAFVRVRVVISLVMSFALGALFVFSNQILAPKNLPVGCSIVRVATRERPFGSGILFKVESDKGVGLVLGSDVYRYNDQIKVCFEEKNIQSASNKYLLSQYRTEYLIKNPTVELASSGKGIIRSIYNLSDNLSTLTTRFYGGDEAVLARGLILGGSSGFSDQTKVNLKRSGTSHIVAVSGYNVSILTIVIFDLLRSSISKKVAGIVTPIFLVVFYLLTGGSASVLRASVMGLIVLTSKFVGRRVSAVHLLVLSLALMLLLNPYSIYDAGFQLSFAAISGIFFMSGKLNYLLERLLKTKTVVVKIFSETIAAQIFTLPILLASFGLFSLIAPLANVVILPLIPLSMLLVAASLASGAISEFLGIFIASISAIFLKFFLFTINFLGSLNFASVIVKMPAQLALILYFAIIYLTVLLGRFVQNEKQKIR